MASRLTATSGEPSCAASLPASNLGGSAAKALHAARSSKPRLHRNGLAIQAAQRSGAVAETGNRRAAALQHGDEKIAQGRLLPVAQMPARRQRAAAAAGEEHRAIVVRVRVAVGEAGAVR